MGRCAACNKKLSEFELTRKHPVTNEYLDLCNTCYKPISHIVPSIVRLDLVHEEDIEDGEPLEEYDLPQMPRHWQGQDGE